ncbi:MAG: GTP pyrophosphokinase family protein [Lachnospiraceae bacterium]|nr:GTP pyrophosphokinase family protein [Lachnospiraceae bacterium]
MSKATDMSLEVLVNSENPEQALKDMQPFIDLMMNYECALMEIETKLKILNTEFALRHNRNPFESIKCRLKQPISIVRKMQKKGLDITIDNIENTLTDIAGIRVICSFPEDIYTLSDLLSKQDDIEVVTVKDYIRNPKKNGYRSLHLIVSVPIFLSDEKKEMKVEVQFRTIAMDFWASLDHKLKYKKDNLKHPEIIAQELKKCADTITSVDYKMQEIRNMLED